MSSADPETPSPITNPKRLPTNHRRRKVPAELRKRTARACNSCNIRRVKCSGDQPCLRCASSSRACEYPPETEKIVVHKETYEDLQKRCQILQQCLADAVPAERNREALLSKWTKASSAPSSKAVLRPEDEEEQEHEHGVGRILRDPDGYQRYLGESSGAAFMDRLREFCGTVVPLLSERQGITFPSMEGMFTALVGQYHTHDSRFLALPDVDPYYLPESGTISKMLTVFRYYAEDGVGAAPCGGIYYWGDLWELEERASKIIPLSGLKDETILLCKLNTIMALACQYDTSLGLPWEQHPGETYFARAKILLGNPMEDASLAYMGTLCLMGYYLLALYRRDAAYMYIGLAARISVVHGLHKGWMISNRGRFGEQSKREFWNTFILDRWLSSLLGRPAMLPEEAVTVEMPSDMDDTDLPAAAGLRAHVKLSMILYEIINDVYAVASSGAGYTQTLSRVDAALKKLSTWQDELPSCLQLPDDGSLPDRARITLHLNHNQLIILCTRPLLFQAVKQAVAMRYISLRQKRLFNPSVSHLKCCVDAARRNANLIRQLMTSNQVAYLASVEYHFPFNAAIVLELGRLLPSTNIPEDEMDIKLFDEYLQQAEEKGNESAADCRNMIIAFNSTVTRLLLDAQMHPATNSSALSLSPEDESLRDTLDESEMSIFRRGVLFSDTQMMSSDGMPLDMNTLGEGQVAAYEELFSWFSDSLC